MDKRIGITSTVPIEVIIAAGRIPVDLNNVFITSGNPTEFIEEAEREGFPRTYCSWIKGIYTAIMRLGLEEVIAVLEGDCSNTHALMEILSMKGIKAIPFSYPYSKDRDELKFQIEKLARSLGTDMLQVENIRESIKPIRKSLTSIDQLTYITNQVSGEENHRYLISSSDFEGDKDAYEVRLNAFINEARHRTARLECVRLGFVGVPPIFSDLYSFINACGGEVVFNETQRQFSMPNHEGDILTQYLSYTYPYDVFSRIEDIKKAIMEREIKGIIHYVQSFCYRQLADLIMRRLIHIPILTLEGEHPSSLDARSRIRIEAFMEMLGA